ncbi:thyrostimulin alpha-2 subunit [Aricia agestis]|uniref:thyrostimulin alpha-2 subunit n=1 Tax=Aricia agestis TaxID=91739 RepID=UPI001C20BE04|nr:thyrostimulin alpha-2 subunit [Aricia agestis]
MYSVTVTDIQARMVLRLLGIILLLSPFLSGQSWKKPGCHRIGHTRTISIPDCVEFNITTNACRGFCESWSVPSIMLGFKRHPVTSLGQCCNMMDSVDLPVKVLCLDGERNLIFKSAVSCACYHCQKE